MEYWREKVPPGVGGGGGGGEAAVPFLLTELSLALKPAQEGRLRGQTVAVAGRLEQLDLRDHLELLRRRGEKVRLAGGGREPGGHREPGGGLQNSRGRTHPTSLLEVVQAALREGHGEETPSEPRTPRTERPL